MDNNSDTSCGSSKWLHDITPEKCDTPEKCGTPEKCDSVVAEEENLQDFIRDFCQKKKIKRAVKTRKYLTDEEADLLY